MSAYVSIPYCRLLSQISTLPFDLSVFHPELVPAPTTWHREQRNQWHLGIPSRATAADSTWSRSDRPGPDDVWLMG